MTAARAHLFVIRMAAFYACLDESDQHRES
jgi:hypothetical protein